MTFGAPLVLIALGAIPLLFVWYLWMQRGRARGQQAFVAAPLTASVLPRRPGICRLASAARRNLATTFSTSPGEAIITMWAQWLAMFLARKLTSYYPFYIEAARKSERIVLASLAGRSGSTDFLDSDDCQADV